MASEVAAYVDVNQFSAGKSEMKCGFYAVWQNHYAGQGKPTGTAADIASHADTSYVQYDGPDTASNANGMSLTQLYSLIGATGGHWQNLAPDGIPGISQGNLKAIIRQWVKLGYPVILAIDEGTVTDMDLNANPYSWKPGPGQYTHIITVTGIQDNAIDFLCRDTASIAPTGVRPGPRKYAATPLDIITATIFVPSWLSRPAGPNPPAPAPVPAPTPAPAPAPETALQKVKDLSAQLAEAIAQL
jgi:hypothetical protein